MDQTIHIDDQPLQNLYMNNVNNESISINLRLEAGFTFQVHFMTMLSACIDNCLRWLPAILILKVIWTIWL